MDGRVRQVSSRLVPSPRGSRRGVGILDVRVDIPLPSVSPGRVRSLLRGDARGPRLRGLVPRRHAHVPLRGTLEVGAILPTALVDVARVLQLRVDPTLTPLTAFLPPALVPLRVPAHVSERPDLRAREPVVVVLEVGSFFPHARERGVFVSRSDRRLALGTCDGVILARGRVRPPRASLPQTLVPHPVPPPPLVDAAVLPQVRPALPVIPPDVLSVVPVVDKLLRVQVGRVSPFGPFLPSPRVPREAVLRVPHVERYPHVAVAAVAVERAVLVPARVYIRAVASGFRNAGLLLPSTRVGTRRGEGAWAFGGDGGVVGVHAPRHVLCGSAQVVLVPALRRCGPGGFVVGVFRGGTFDLFRGGIIAGLGRRWPDAVRGLLGAVAVRAAVLPSTLVQASLRRVR